MPRAIKSAAGSIENAADWAAVLLQDVHSGRAIEVRADVKRILAGDWGGLEFRLKPDDGPPVNLNEQGGN